MEPVLRPTVVLLMGVTGVGKSAFISRLTGQDVGIGHDLTSQTAGVGIFSMEFEGRLINLVDTPGFNDAARSDLDILKEISFLLAQIRRSGDGGAGAELAGIIYLHRISDNRVGGSARRNFDMLRRLCGEEGSRHVALVTTMWDLVVDGGGGGRDDHHNQVVVSFEEALARERQLVGTDEYWGRLCRGGSLVRRSREDNDASSTRSILADLLAVRRGGGGATLQIQRELVDEGKKLLETSAGAGLWATYDALEEQQQQQQQYGKGEEEILSVLLQDARAELRAATLQSISEERERVYAGLLTTIREQKRAAEAELENQRRAYARFEADSARNEALFKEEQRDWWRRRDLLEEQRRWRYREEDKEEERRLLEEEETLFRAQFEEDQTRNEEARLRTAETAQRLRKRSVMKRNLVPLLGVLAGAGLTAAGGATGLVPLIVGGAGLVWGSAGSLNFSRSIKQNGDQKSGGKQDSPLATAAHVSTIAGDVG